MPASRPQTIQQRDKVLVLGSLATSLVNFRADLIQELARRGYDVLAAAPDMTETVAAKLQKMGARPIAVKLQRTGMNPLRDMVSLFRLWRLLREEKPRAIFTYTAKPVLYGTLAARLAGVPQRIAMITGLGYAFMDGHEFKRKCARIAASMLYGLILPQATAVVFQNPDDQKLFTELRFLTARTRHGIVRGSGVNTRHFNVEALPKRPGFLMIARFIKDKGIREYTIAATRLKAEMPEVNIALVGWRDPSPNSVSESEINSWTVAGLQNHGRLTDVRPAISDASVIVLPSYREGTPRSVLEGMAMGRAVITTDAPGCRETVKPNINGILVPPRDSEALFLAMRRLAMNPATVADMGKASRQLIEEVYDAVRVAEQTLDLAGLTGAHAA